MDAICPDKLVHDQTTSMLN